MEKHTIKILVTARSSQVASWISNNTPAHYSVDLASREQVPQLTEIEHYDVIFLILPNNDIAQLSKSLNIFDHYYGKIVVCCSVSALSQRADKFVYSRNCTKFYESALQAKSKNKNQNIFPILFGTFDKPTRSGQKYVHQDDFEDVILDPANFQTCYRVHGRVYQHYKIIENILGTKVTAAIFKYLTKYTYGYNL